MYVSLHCSQVHTVSSVDTIVVVPVICLCLVIADLIDHWLTVSYSELVILVDSLEYLINVLLHMIWPLVFYCVYYFHYSFICYCGSWFIIAHGYLFGYVCV